VISWQGQWSVCLLNNNHHMKDLKNTFLSENPIDSIDDDAFNFKHYAEKVRNLIQLNADNPEPIVIGIHGKWGEGKTSFLNLVERKIDLFEQVKKEKGILKFHFNPWRYKTEDEMLFDFFHGLSKTMYLEKDNELNKVGENIVRLSRYLKAVKISSTVGVPGFLNTKVDFEIDKVFKQLGEDIKGDEPTIESIKSKVNNALEQSNYKIFVLIDDIDRLDKNEIYTILKLIKLNANFKNFIYLVALDTQQVARAIGKRYGKSEKDGLAFLEKIINIPIHLPRIEEADLKHFFEQKLFTISNLIEFTDKEKADKEFNKIKYEFRKGQFKSPREIIKVMNSFYIGLFALQDEINIRDLFWIEYIKIKNEDCYGFLKNYVLDNYVVDSGEFIIDFNENYFGEGNPRGEIFERYSEITNILDLLFPIKLDPGVADFSRKEVKLEDLRKEIRINHSEHFDKYFSYHLERKVSVKVILKIKELIAKEDSENLKKELIAFLKDIETYKKLYKIEELIIETKEDKSRGFFYNFLIENMSLIPFDDSDVFGISYHNRILELIANLLKSNSKNNDVILEIANKLNSTQLCHFTRKFDDNDFKIKLEKLIVKRIKQEVKKEEKPFYSNAYDMSNKMKMHYWNKIDKKGFEDYINETTNIKENILFLIRNFPSFWNNKYFGGLEIENYYYIQKLIDVDVLYSKIKSFFPDIISKVDSKYPVDNYRDESTIEENLEEFIYLHKKEKKAW